VGLIFLIPILQLYVMTYAQNNHEHKNEIKRIYGREKSACVFRAIRCFAYYLMFPLKYECLHGCHGNQLLLLIFIVHGSEFLCFKICLCIFVLKDDRGVFCALPKGAAADPDAESRRVTPDKPLAAQLFH
jgi:hypothetical protein